ncbi:MAG: hypothetical protein H0U65_10205 [Rubrobacter sp.]|jgi:hypothetical protein|nr:hypothetical protein [Rubrobacter sp.]
MILRDYLYLDTDRLQDYMSGLDPGIIEDLVDTQRSQSSGQAKAGVKVPAVLEAGGGGAHESESILQRSMRVTSQHMFSRVYDALRDADSLKVFDEDSSLHQDNVKRREVVEITRDFKPSPMSDLVENLLSLMNTMRGMGFVEEVSDPESRQAIQALAMIFRGEEGNEEIPMVARAERMPSNTEASVVFLAKSRFMLADSGDFEGEMTVFGKVSKIVPESQSIDLFDFIKLPRAFAREKSFKKELLDMFESWPLEFGGPISKESLKVSGPVVVVTPVAVYEA